YASVGRTVTALLGLILLASLYGILRKLGVSPILAAGSVALVVLNQGFVWAVHSARYDLLTGLSLLWLVFFFSKENKFSLGRCFFLRFATIGAILFSRHLLTLALPPLIVLLSCTHASSHPKQFM